MEWNALLLQFNNRLYNMVVVLIHIMGASEYTNLQDASNAQESDDEDQQKKCKLRCYTCNTTSCQHTVQALGGLDVMPITRNPLARDVSALLDDNGDDGRHNRVLKLKKQESETDEEFEERRMKKRVKRQEKKLTIFL